MKTIKILINRHYDFNSTHLTKILIDSILPHLQKKFNVKIIWFVTMQTKNAFHNTNNEEFIFIQDFKNAVDVLKFVKPDLIFDNEYPSIMDLSLDFAAKYLEIPIVTRMFFTEEIILSKTKLLTKFLPLFFQSDIPSSNNSQKSFMNRGRFFLHKYRFFIKTLFASKKNFFQVCNLFFITFNYHLNYRVPFIDKRFNNDLHFIDSKILFQKLLSAGYEKSSLELTGNPMYDTSFKKIHTLEQKSPDSKKINILFIPLQNYEGGLWTKSQRDNVIISILNELNSNPNYEVTIKLHPSSQSYLEYDNLISSISKKFIISQKGDLLDFLEKTDVIISYPPTSSAQIFALLTKKPLIICNFYDESSRLLENDLVVECKNKNDLLKIINDSINSPKNSEKNLKHFIEKYLFSDDGNSGIRVAESIEKLLLNL